MSMEIAAECLHNGLYVPHLAIADGSWFEWRRKHIVVAPKPKRNKWRKALHTCLDCPEQIDYRSKRCRVCVMAVARQAKQKAN